MAEPEVTLATISRQLAALEDHQNRVELRLERLDTKLDGLEKRLGSLEGRLESHFDLLIALLTLGRP